MNANPESLPSPEYLRQRLRYEPETGKLFWHRHCDKHARFNRKWGGREAFLTIRCGYHYGTIDGRKFQAHRVIWALVTGAWPSGEIDHIDGRRPNNRWENLRDVDRPTNSRNAAMPANNTSGVVGVCRDRNANKWRAYIGVGNRTITLGNFEEFGDAVAARKDTERGLGFHPNHGRPSHMAEVRP